MNTNKRSIIRKTEKLPCKNGEITNFYYECDNGSFVVSYEPCGNPKQLKIGYIAHNFSTNYPLDNFEKQMFEISSNKVFDKIGDAVKYAEHLIDEVVGTAKKSNEEIADKAKNNSSRWLD